MSDLPTDADPSPLFLSQRSAIRKRSASGPVLDVACGRGRHTIALAQDGIPCIALDRKTDFLVPLAHWGRAQNHPLQCVQTNLENPYGLPLQSGVFSTILVFRFLYRPLASALMEALAPGGYLIYETFTEAQANCPKGPNSKEFLLGKNELPALFKALTLLEYEEGLLEDSQSPSHLARFVARKKE
jgi:tellurite methyltransferase